MMQISIVAKQIKNTGMSTIGIGEKPVAVIVDINEALATFAFFIPFPYLLL